MQRAISRSMDINTMWSVQTMEHYSILKRNEHLGCFHVQRDPVEREVGGGIGMGNTCKSMADSRQCMIKTTTIL